VVGAVAGEDNQAVLEYKAENKVEERFVVAFSVTPQVNLEVFQS
jgi:hypothetical protein